MPGTAELPPVSYFPPSCILRPNLNNATGLHLTNAILLHVEVFKTSRLVLAQSPALFGLAKDTSCQSPARHCHTRNRPRLHSSGSVPETSSIMFSVHEREGSFCFSLLCINVLTKDVFLWYGDDIAVVTVITSSISFYSISRKFIVIFFPARRSRRTVYQFGVPTKKDETKNGAWKGGLFGIRRWGGLSKNLKYDWFGFSHTCFPGISGRLLFLHTKNFISPTIIIILMIILSSVFSQYTLSKGLFSKYLLSKCLLSRVPSPNAFRSKMSLQIRQFHVILGHH